MENMFSTGIYYNGWVMQVHAHENQIIVTKDDETRVYDDFPHQIAGVKQNTEFPNYIHILFSDTDNFNDEHLQFKFEDGSFLVGDIFDKNGHVREYACHVFGEINPPLV